MKKNIFSTIVSLILFIGIVYFGHTTYTYYQFLHSDDPVEPFLEVVGGNATIVRSGDYAIDMGSGETYLIQEDDMIRTDTGGLAVITWPDHSFTRLGSASRLLVNKMEVSDDYSKIEIELALKEGKFWTNVVRTIYPGSYFRAKLPEGGVIAGVRGTVFDINLEKSYIQSIDHSVALSDALGHTVSLLPGEAVNARNIIEKIGTVIRDQIWNDLNSAQDHALSVIRESRIDEDIARFSHGSVSFAERCVRWILSFFGAFRGLEVIDLIQNAGSSSGQLAQLPQATLLKWYQFFQDKKFVEQRDLIRVSLTQNQDLTREYLDVLARASIWDSLASSGVTLESTKILLRSYTNNMDSRIKNVLNVIPVKELETKARETLRTLIQ